MNDEAVAITVFAFSIIALFFGLMWGTCHGEHTIKLQAVATHHADYVISDSATGATTFQWRNTK